MDNLNKNPSKKQNKVKYTILKLWIQVSIIMKTDQLIYRQLRMKFKKSNPVWKIGKIKQKINHIN